MWIVGKNNDADSSGVLGWEHSDELLGVRACVTEDLLSPELLLLLFLFCELNYLFYFLMDVHPSVLCIAISSTDEKRTGQVLHALMMYEGCTRHYVCVDYSAAVSLTSPWFCWPLNMCLWHPNTFY